MEIGSVAKKEASRRARRISTRRPPGLPPPFPVGGCRREVGCGDKHGHLHHTSSLSSSHTPPDQPLPELIYNTCDPTGDPATDRCPSFAPF
ncbi:hypothetical protein E2562_012951 [Oryza meyeriana var. granulata]|uniref:Uncharacterized protein n=1 Tax=Oryza meyeriana var. granulata TaxID=110450 RepID=A0A6G1DGW4_9ORYZ|nr:hypothetical protein E2562_012951 [Oryza meyeriana var. granulata]